MTHGKNKRNFEVSPVMDFIAAITQYIPDQSFQLVRYYGWYSNRMRGDRKSKSRRRRRKVRPARLRSSTFGNTGRQKIPLLLWRACIKKIWEVDPLSCPRCQGVMRIISFIVQAEVIRKILVHLDQWEAYTQARPPPEFSRALKA